MARPESSSGIRREPRWLVGLRASLACLCLLTGNPSWADSLNDRFNAAWESLWHQGGEAFAVRLAVTGEDRRGLYADIMEAVSQTGTNIRGADLHTKDGSVFGTIFVEVDNLPHLAKVLKAVRRVKGVTTVERRETPPGK